MSVETDYGLIVEFLPDASVNTKLNNSVAISPEKAPHHVTVDDSEETKFGLRYRMFPDWGTNHLFYDSSWPSNPQDALTAEDGEILRDQRGTTEETALRTWLQAYKGWATKYDEAFDNELNKTGDFHREVFPDVKVRKAWTLEGMMLAVWLALQPKVDTVEFSPGTKKVIFSARGCDGQSLNDTLGQFLAELDSHLK